MYKLVKLVALSIAMVLSFQTLLARSSEQVLGPKNIGENTGRASGPIRKVRVHKAGLLWQSVTNFGAIGNPADLKNPCNGRTAIASELPGGSGINFLFSGSIWFGGYLDVGKDAEIWDYLDEEYPNNDNQITRALGGRGRFLGPLVTTAYEGWSGVGGQMQELFSWDLKGVGAGKEGQFKETSNVVGKLNCFLEDVYDPAATAEEQFEVWMSDWWTDISDTHQDDVDTREHIPLGVQVKQKSYAWSYEYAQKFIVFDYTFYNTNDKDIYDFFIGQYMDPDVGRGEGVAFDGGQIERIAGDDIGGFIHTYEYTDPATNITRKVPLQLAWVADNDGREYSTDDMNNTVPINHAPAGTALDGATGVAAIKVLRNPNPKLKYAYNSYVAGSNNETIDWGPRWRDGLHNTDGPITYDDGVTAYGVKWQYDLSYLQLGYDDTNHDNIGGLIGGRTEGRPSGDKGRYQVMSNDEFDYDQIEIKRVHLGTYTDPANIPEEYAQKNKWRPWKIGDDETSDGSEERMNWLAQGGDSKFVISFGPLGYTETVSFDTDKGPLTKDVWKFRSGDSLKLTLAFIVNTDFHISTQQDANVEENGYYIDNNLFNWNDAMRNVIWTQRVYDVPLKDTPVRKADGTVKVDGWFGEDIGADALFGEKNQVCWWTQNNPAWPGGEQVYTLPDEGEGDFEITNFSTPVSYNGHESTSEDNFMPMGNETVVNDSVGTTEDYGYIVEVKENGEYVRRRFGFKDELLNAGDGIPDFTGPPPPPSPKIEITYDDNNVNIVWTSDNFNTPATAPETFKDPFTRLVDFEGYQIWISPTETATDYVKIFSLDKENYIYESSSRPGTYLDIPFTYDGIPEDSIEIVYPTTINTLDDLWIKTPFGANKDLKGNYETSSYAYRATYREPGLDEFGVSHDNAYWEYKFTLKNKPYGYQQYVAVTSSDFGDPKSKVTPLTSQPAENGTYFNPTTVKGSDDVYVVPNPYRNDVDYGAVGWEPDGVSEAWNEQDRKIVFFNIPEKSIIRIYTLAGDLVKVIAHNGKSYDVEGVNAERWNLINDNNQTVTSGVYLFQVEDMDDDGYDFVGKFVIIK